MTSILGEQIRDDSVKRLDLNVTTAGSSVIRKALEDANAIISLSSTGVDAGTGDVTIKHKDTLGYKHIPTGGSIGNFLINSASGTTIWSTDLYWDNTNKRLGVNTLTPIANTHINGSVYIAGGDGDVNASGTITAADAALVLTYSIGTTIPTATQFARANISGNGITSFFDAKLITAKVSYGWDYNTEANKLNIKRAIGKVAYPKLDGTWGATADWTNVGYGFGLIGASSEIMTFSKNYNVGIGTIEPVANFQVNQPTYAYGKVSNTAGGTTVTGTDTKFTNTFKVGDTITIGGQTVTIQAIASDTSMTTSTITNANTSVSYTLAGGTRFIVKGNGYAGFSTLSPIANAHVNGSIYFKGGNGDNDNNGLTDIDDMLNSIDFVNNNLSFSELQYAASDVLGTGLVNMFSSFSIGLDYNYPGFLNTYKNQLKRAQANSIYPSFASNFNYTTPNWFNIDYGIGLVSRGASISPAININQYGDVSIGTSIRNANFQIGQITDGVGTVSNGAGANIVTGTNTYFTNTFKVGDTITIGSDTVVIYEITSDTLMSTATITSAHSNATYSLVGGTRFIVLGNGQMGGGGITVPTATLHLYAQNGEPGSAPLKFGTSDTLLKSPEAGAFEADNLYLYYTVPNNSDPLRRTVVFSDSANDLNFQTGYGITINNAATAGTFLKGDGTRFTSGTFDASDIPTLTISQLVSYNSTAITQVYISDAYKYGIFRHDSTDTTTVHDGIMTIVSANNQRYKRVDSVVRPRYFGAVGDGTTNDLTALNACFAYITRGVIDLEGKAYKVNGTLLIENKNVGSGNTELDGPHISGLTINGCGARIITDNVATLDLLQISSCKRIYINNLQVDGLTTITRFWESSFQGCFFKGLRSCYINPLNNDTAVYNVKWDSCTIGYIKIYTGTVAYKTEFNQNTFLNTKIGYGMGAVDIPIQIYGTANAQSVTFYSCDIYAPMISPMLYVDLTVDDVSLVFLGANYFDSGAGLPSNLKNVKVYNRGMFVDPVGKQFDYTTMETASNTPMFVTSHPQNGSRVSHSAVNLIVNGNFQDALDPAVNIGYTATYLTTSPLHSRFLRLQNTAGSDTKYYNFNSVVIPFTGTYSLSLIGQKNAGTVLISWQYYRGSGPWVEVQNGIIDIATTNTPTWDGVTVQLQKGDLFRILVMSSTIGTDMYIYDVSLTLGVESILYAANMHPNAVASTNVSLAAIGSSPNANGATLTGQVLNLQPASSTFGGILTTGAQVLSGIKEFVSGLFAIKLLAPANYGQSADVGVTIGMPNGDSVDDTKPFQWRWWVKGNGSGQLMYLQVKRCVYVAGVYHPELEVWEDTGVRTDANGYLIVQNATTDDHVMNRKYSDGRYLAKIGSAPTGYTTFTNLTSNKTLDANATTTDEVADVLGTLIEDLKTRGIISA